MASLSQRLDKEIETISKTVYPQTLPPSPPVAKNSSKYYYLKGSLTGWSVME